MQSTRLRPIAQGDRQRVAELFQGYRWNYLPEAILEGSVGEVLADDNTCPQVAVLTIPKLKLFIPGGAASHPAARDTLEKLPRFASLIFASEGWDTLVTQLHGGKLIGMQRYPFSSESLELGHLRSLATRLPDGYRLEQLDTRLAMRLAAEGSEFASGHLGNFGSPEDFIARGFGFCILAGEEIVSAATTFAVCSKGIEIQVSTREKQQGQGLATAVSAQLLIHSLENNLDPNWDAENLRSVGLAKKLGYAPRGAYTLWLFTGSRATTGLVKVGFRIRQFFQPGTA